MYKRLYHSKHTASTLLGFMYRQRIYINTNTVPEARAMLVMGSEEVLDAKTVSGLPAHTSPSFL